MDNGSGACSVASQLQLLESPKSGEWSQKIGRIRPLHQNVSKEGDAYGMRAPLQASPVDGRLLPDGVLTDNWPGILYSGQSRRRDSDFNKSSPVRFVNVSNQLNQDVEKSH